MSLKALRRHVATLGSPGWDVAWGQAGALISPSAQPNWSSEPGLVLTRVGREMKGSQMEGLAWHFETDTLLLRTKEEDAQEGPSQEKQGRDVLQC